MERQEVELFLTRSGYVKDRYGNLKKTVSRLVNEKPTEKEFRIKLQVHTIRVEVRTSLGEWVRIGGAYYKNINFVKGVLMVGSLAFKGGANP